MWVFFPHTTLNPVTIQMKTSSRLPSIHQHFAAYILPRQPWMTFVGFTRLRGEFVSGRLKYELGCWHKT